MSLCLECQSNCALHLAKNNGLSSFYDASTHKGMQFQCMPALCMPVWDLCASMSNSGQSQVPKHLR